MEKILLGMSGGVDSTAAASILKESGYSVHGVFFIMDECHQGLSGDARIAAEQAGVPIDVVDLRSEFDRLVKKPFADEYLSGKTPNPCVLCNRFVKFPFLARHADGLGIEKIATGHYASVTDINGKHFISKAADEKKDQSYFLWALGQDVLSRLVLPLSSMTKDEIREYAAAHGFSAASKRDSQDVCFIPDGDSGRFVSMYSGTNGCEGKFVDCSGKILGVHRGIFNYTVGQRRGLGIAAEAPLYVLNIQPAENTVVLGRENELYSDIVVISDCIFAGDEIPGKEFNADVCLRYTKKKAPARIECDGKNCIAYFETPQRAPAPGQSAVFYVGNTVIGGGIIQKNAT